MERIGPACIALLEDDAGLREFVSDLLRLEGHDVAACGSTEQALETITRQPVDLAIVDLHLEGGSSWPLLDRLVSTRTTRALPLIVYTGATEELGPRRAFIEQHGIQVLAKPFDLDELVALVGAALAEKRATERPDDGGMRQGSTNLAT